MLYNCPSCNASFEKVNRFCEKCGCNLMQEFIANPICPECKKEYPANTKYCHKDGCKLVRPEDLVPRCSICKQEYSEEVKFCPQDGGKVGVLLNNKKPIYQKKLISDSKQEMLIRFFSFEGRIRRYEYFVNAFIFPFFYYGICTLLMGLSKNSALEGVFVVLVVISFIPFFLFILAQNTKRSHDIGNSGWYQLIPFYTVWLLYQFRY